MCEISAGKLMLEIRNYSRQELIELYKTERLDYIKKKIKKEGYAFNDCGRGKNYIMKITALPETLVIYPGHGPISRIEIEKKNNPYLR